MKDFSLWKGNISDHSHHLVFQSEVKTITPRWNLSEDKEHSCRKMLKKWKKTNGQWENCSEQRGETKEQRTESNVTSKTNE